MLTEFLLLIFTYQEKIFLPLCQALPTQAQPWTPAPLFGVQLPVRPRECSHQTRPALPFAQIEPIGWHLHQSHPQLWKEPDGWVGCIISLGFKIHLFKFLLIRSVNVC